MNFSQKKGKRLVRTSRIFLGISLLFISSLPTFSVKIPTSPRSEEVVKQLTPTLTSNFEQKGLSLGSPVYLRIFKAEKELEVWVKYSDQFKLYKTYRVCYFSGGLGSKKREGDGKSPEGFYYVKPGQLNPWSTFHLSFNIGYPNRYDRSLGYTGGLIMVHGNCVSIGCYAMTDRQIKEIYTIIHKAFEGGQPYFRIHIFPFKMTDLNMKKYRDMDWQKFWENLKEGYDWFEKHKSPPNVTVRNKKYIFN